MPAKGSCCCVTPPGSATMWKVNVFTGEVVEALEYTHAYPVEPASGICGIDDYDAVEFGDHLTATPNSRLWSKAGGSIWGPLTDRTNDEARGWARFVNDRIVYGGALRTAHISGFAWTSPFVGSQAVQTLLRSDGSQAAHSMSGNFLIEAGSDYVDTFAFVGAPTNVATIRRYADDFSTLVTSTTQAMAPSSGFRPVAFNQTTYAMLSGATVKVIEPSDLSTRFTVTGAPSCDAVAVDDEGGIYTDVQGAFPGRILKYSSSTTPDWDVTDFFPSLRFAALGHAYGLSTTLTKIDGADGSIAWTLDLSSFISLTNGFSETQTTGHSGILLLPCGADGLIAVDDEYGTVAWFSANKGYGKPIPDGADYVWLSGEYGL